MTQWGQAPLNSEGRVGMKFRCKITGEDGNTVYTNVVTAEKKNEIIDGLEALTNLFSNDKALLIEHVITNTYFFEKDSVLDYTTKTCKDICEEKAIPVRYPSSGGGVFWI